MKKKLNFLLILAVLSLWGTAGYRFVKNNFPSENSTSVPHFDTKPLSLLVKRDTFELRLPERDPFMGKLIVQGRARSQSAPANRQPIVARKATTNGPEQEIVWPDITYFGNIKAATAEMAVVKVAGKIYRLHCGEQASGILLKNMNDGKIELVYNREMRVFRLDRNGTTK